MWSRYPHGWTKGIVLGTCLASSPKLCVTHVPECPCPFCWLVSVSFEMDIKVFSYQNPVYSLGPTNGQKIKKVSAVPQCVWLLGNRCFQIGCHWCFTLLVLSKANESSQKQLLLLEEEILWDMSQIHGKESLMISAVHRSARILGCFFSFMKILNCYVCLFFSFLVNLFKV